VRLGLGVALESEERIDEKGACLPILGLERDGFLQWGNRSLGTAESQARGAEEQGGGQGIGLSAQRGFELRERLPVLAGQVESHPEVQEEAGVSGNRSQEPPVHGHGLRVAAGGHQLRAALRHRSEVRIRGKDLRRAGEKEDQWK
jgi:hypothetical protein